MRIGDCFKNLGDDTTARLYYEELIKEYPKSEEASKARESLAKLGKGGKDKG
jgi:TolA-binding protein